MLYAITLTDKPGTEGLRAEHRDGHLAHFRANKTMIALSGPLSDDAGETVGSLVIVETACNSTAREFIEADPFYAAGVWGNISIAALKASIFDPAKFSS